MSYTPTNWVDGETPVNAENLNKLEQAVKTNDSAINEINTARENGEFKGDNGVTPHIGNNGNWYIGETDTGKPSVGDPNEAIIQQVIAALSTPVFGRVDENNNIILSGNLADGTYTLMYEDENGKTTYIGTISGAVASTPIPLTFQRGKIDYDNGGAIVNDASYAYSDPVDIKSDMAYVLKWSGCAIAVRVCYYDDSDSYLGVTESYGDRYVMATDCMAVPYFNGASKFRLRIGIGYFEDTTVDAQFAAMQQNTTLDEVDVYKQTVLSSVIGRAEKVDANNDDNRIYFYDSIAEEGTSSYRVVYQVNGTVPLYRDKAFTTPTAYYPVKVPAGKTKMTVEFPYLDAGKTVVMYVRPSVLSNGFYMQSGDTTTLEEGVYTYTIPSETQYVTISCRRNDWSGMENYNLNGATITWE